VICSVFFLEFYLLEENATAFVFAVPVFGAVEVPIFAECRGEGFGEEEKLDGIAAGGDVFFVADKGGVVFVYVGQAGLGAFFGFGLEVLIYEAVGRVTVAQGEAI
jgi:hypothetical protein